MKQRLHKASMVMYTLLIFSLITCLYIQNFVSLPKGQNVTIGDPIRPHLIAPRPILQNMSYNLSLENGLMENKNFIGSAAPVATTPGTMNMQLKLFGFIPLHRMVVNVVPPITVVPGGQSIGVMLHAQGVIVVGQASIKDTEGNKRNPAAEAGISLGDVILKVNGKPAKSDSQVRDEIAQTGSSGQDVVLEIKHGKRIFTTKVKPVFCSETKRFRVGLFIRDSAAGVGTLSFYDPGSKKYGALGHVINDVDTAQKIDLADGKILGASVQGIHPGKRGQPGEKIGLFEANTNIVGNINKNTQYGIFGTLNNHISNPFYPQPLPVAMSYQIKEGPAEILTVLKDNKLERFSIEILEVDTRAKSNGKGLVIKVTDPELLQKTGGIIQGMSGSPIIQDKKFVGAVTHVFVNDPTRGYGVLAEWMLMEAGILKVDRQTNELKSAG